jgi:hypothetical protein
MRLQSWYTRWEADSHEARTRPRRPAENRGCYVAIYIQRLEEGQQRFGSLRIRWGKGACIRDFQYSPIIGTGSLQKLPLPVVWCCATCRRSPAYQVDRERQFQDMTRVNFVRHVCRFNRDLISRLPAPRSQSNMGRSEKKSLFSINQATS